MLPPIIRNQLAEILLPDEEVLMQRACDRGWLVNLMWGKGSFALSALIHLTGFAQERMRQALDHEWFKMIDGRWRLNPRTEEQAVDLCRSV